MRRTKRSIFLLFTFAAILSLLVAACGDDEDDTGGVGDAPVSTSTAAAGADATEPADDDDDDTDAVDAGDGDAEEGRAIWQAQCAACHTIDGGEAIGPTWQGLWMSEVALDDGSTVTADEAYITESIQDPNAQIVEGYSGVMPQLDLDDDEIADVIAFIQTLE
ncbi:hypothetical protein BH24CHL1_BH24CHL1_04530 [soil metagenome]